MSLQGEFQRKLYKELVRNYNPLERPVANDSQPLTVHFSLSLLQIMDVVSTGAAAAGSRGSWKRRLAGRRGLARTLELALGQAGRRSDPDWPFSAVCLSLPTCQIETSAARSTALPPVRGYFSPAFPPAEKLRAKAS